MAQSPRIGIIGAGRVAQEHVRGIIAAGGQLVAIYDDVPENAQQLAAFSEATASEFGVNVSPALPATLEELLACNVQGVVIAVPNVSHAELACASLRAGVDVLLEKPMAMSVNQCDAIIAAMEAHDRQVQIGFVCRAAPKIQLAQQLIERGELGEVYHIKASMYRQRGIPGLGGWFTTRALSGGGVLIDIGVHLIDLILHLTGSASGQTVSGMCEQRFGSPIEHYVYEEMWAGPPRLDGVCDVEDSAMGFLRLDRGITCELNVAWASNMPNQLLPDGILVLGDRGGLFLDIWGDKFTLTSEVDGRIVDTPIECDNSDAWNRAWQAQHARFGEVIQRRSEPLATAAAGRAVQEIIAAWQASSDRGREVVIE
jgi:predicted dehydrogenase